MSNKSYMKVNKNIYTLGICNCETSSACLFINDSLVSAVSEERFSRKKYDRSFPTQSINYILKEYNIKLRRIDNISYSWSKGFQASLKKKYDKRFSYLKKTNVVASKIFSDRYKYDILQDKNYRNEFNQWVKVSLTKKQKKNLKIFYHHEAHAANASLLSSFDKGIVLTADGRGDFEALTVSLFNRNKKYPLKKIYSSTSSDSLGYFYGRITSLLGFKPMAHEGKITGLAAYGNPKKALPLMEKMIKFKNGELTASLGDLYKPFFKGYSKNLTNELKKYSREDIAAAAQQHLENCVCEITKYYLKKLKLKSTNLMLSGGVFANVKVNYHLKSIKFINKVFVQPQMGDGGLCLGAAALHLHGQKIKIKQLDDVYLGPSIRFSNIKKLSKKFPTIKIVKCKLTHDKICEDLKKNKVLGLVRGKMEFGPRALCNRSIIYKTSDKSINNWLNKRMNRTEFMPFAPVIRHETAKLAFEKYTFNDPTFNFMTSTIKCTNVFKRKCPAVTHIDKTTRPQVVYKKKDLFLWTLLKKWEKQSGEMSLVNTSFNAHEEPIICNEKEAVNALIRGMIDVLYIEEFRITVSKPPLIYRKIKMLSKKTSQLSTKEIKSVCLLKDTHWKYGLNSQLTWFKKNVKSLDIHNMLLINKKLVGYTLLRIRKIKSDITRNYFLFDTLIIKKELRKTKLSNSLMSLNKDIILKNKKIAFLTCKKQLIKYYKKYGWSKLNNKQIKIIDGKRNMYGMFFNYKKSYIKGFFSLRLHASK